MRIYGLVCSMMFPIVLSAQTTPMAMDHHMTMPGMLSQSARDQVAEARRVAAMYDTPEKARAAGYRPRFGDVPLQGEHWSNPALVLAGKFDLEHPPILMYAPIGGSEKLIGVAFAYEVTQDAPVPDGFDGEAMWHEHPALALPGHRLVMTHVWFIDSPNGVFAHDNPTIAFLERGIGYPPDGWLDATALRKLALTLSLARPPLPLGGRLGSMERNDSLLHVLMTERAGVDSMVPKLEAARMSENAAEYRKVATKIGNQAETIIATVKQVPADPVTRLFFGRLIDEALSDHPAPGGTPQ